MLDFLRQEDSPEAVPFIQSEALKIATVSPFFLTMPLTFF